MHFSQFLRYRTAVLQKETLEREKTKIASPNISILNLLFPFIFPSGFLLFPFQKQFMVYGDVRAIICYMRA